jgi:peptide/nickel transport system permease protein
MAAPSADTRNLGVGFWLASGWVALVAVLALLANVLPLPGPTELVAPPGEGPGWHHLLGTDELGRDLLSRLVFGSRVSLVVAVFALLFGFVVGGSLGLVAGYFRGPLDMLIVGYSSVMLAFPALVFALAIVTFTGPSLFHVTLAIGILATAPLAVVVRGSTIVFAQREFVTAARMLGARSSRIIYREILANVLPGAMALALVAAPVAIVAEGSLSFLGLSVREPTPSWGNMIAEGHVVLAQYPMVALWPAVALFVTVLALNLAGERLRSYLDVREGGL